jgi:hypothetical protein
MSDDKASKWQHKVISILMANGSLRAQFQQRWHVVKYCRVALDTSTVRADAWHRICAISAVDTFRTRAGACTAFEFCASICT